MIDKQAILEHADLLTLAENDTQLRRVAGTNGGEWAGPCPFCGGSDRFRVQPNRKPWGLWMCRNCTTGKWQNAIDYVIKRDGSDFKTACATLSGGDLPNTSTRRQPEPIPAYSPTGGEWQVRAWKVIEKCAAALWQPGGARALDWLHWRGLDDDTIRYYWLGFSPGLPGIPSGVVIPCQAGGEVWYLKIALLPGDLVRCEGSQKGKEHKARAREVCPICGKVNKYTGVTGNRTNAIFGADNLAGRDIALFVEGEFNAIVADQVLYSAIGVASLGGSASNSIDLATWGAYLLGLQNILVLYDPDKAGKAGVARLTGLTDRAQVCTLPQGVKDINEYYQAGGDLYAWLAGEMERLGILAHLAEPLKL